MKIRTLLLTSARRSALHAGCILIPPPSLRSIPSPHDLPAPACHTADRPPNEVARQAGGEVGRGSGRGDFKRARQFDGRAPLSSPLPARASQGEGPLQRWWVYQAAPLHAFTLVELLLVLVILGILA